MTDWINAMLGDSSVNAWIAQQPVRVTWPLRFRSDVTHATRDVNNSGESCVFRVSGADVTPATVRSHVICIYFSSVDYQSEPRLSQ
jgi:hypothetical protein